MSKEITLSNIYNFIEGNVRLLTETLQPEHIKQQIAYRILMCSKDCVISKECIKCGCPHPDRAYSSQSCNIDRFPNFLSKLDWEEFKIKNNIK